ncbi:MAG: monovalent cation/H(+) antiporter subunit G [Clostridiales bacterium]
MIRTVLAALLMGAGLFVLAVATLGIFRFRYVLNRIHVAAKCDTLGAMLFLSGLAVLEGFSFAAFKLILIIIFLWFTNPVASHLVTRVEFQTAAELEHECEVIRDRKEGGAGQ